MYKLKYIIIILIALWFGYTIHNPDILSKKDIPKNSILSPAYGYINKVIKYQDHTTIIISLNIFDNHVQYVPCDSRVMRVKHIQGTHPWMGESENAEQQHFVLQSEAGTIVVIQRAGFIYRRIHSKVKPGQDVNTNDVLGNIDFGSMVVVKLPNTVNITVKQGDRVNGGRTVLATLD